MSRHRPRAVAAPLLALLALALGFAVPAARAADVTFGMPTASAVFGSGVTFVQPISVAAPIRRAELLITFPTALGPIVHTVAVQAGTGALTLRGEWSETADGHLVPNMPLAARWRITPTGGSAVEGPTVGVLYADTRFAWKTISGPLVRLHWYEGSDAFARQALAVGEKGIQQAVDLLGVKETAPIDFFVYASQAPFRDALGPGIRENVGGEAHADIRTMFALIGPGAVGDSWVSVVIPHELTHLVFDTAVRNSYHLPPRWLNEGLAVYLSEGYTVSWRADVMQAVSQHSLLSLQGLSGQFPTSADGFALAYGESVAAIDFFVRTYGRGRLVALIRSYAAGRTDDEAFTQALGVDVGAFESAWLGDLGATAPERYGPQPAPAAPLPPGWSGPAATGAAAAGGGITTPVGGAASAAGPGFGRAGAETSPPAAPGGVDGSGASDGVVLVAITLAGLGVGGLLAYVRRRPRADVHGQGDSGPPEIRP